jgi:hypothetical protein
MDSAVFLSGERNLARIGEPPHGNGFLGCSEQRKKAANAVEFFPQVFPVSLC